MFKIKSPFGVFLVLGALFGIWFFSLNRDYSTSETQNSVSSSTSSGGAANQESHSSLEIDSGDSGNTNSSTKLAAEPNSNVYADAEFVVMLVDALSPIVELKDPNKIHNALNEFGFEFDVEKQSSIEESSSGYRVIETQKKIVNGVYGMRLQYVVQNSTKNFEGIRFAARIRKDKSAGSAGFEDALPEAWVIENSKDDFQLWRHPSGLTFWTRDYSKSERLPPIGNAKDATFFAFETAVPSYTR